MNKFIKITLFFLLFYSNQSTWAQWLEDDLGGRFEKKYIDQGTDYSGQIRSTIIRLTDSIGIQKRGVLYIHGFNDYFFQRELAEEFVNHHYDFYAVDLRKYGRSLMDGQKAFQVRNLKEYFPDIDSALIEMDRAGIDEIVLMGHSTGGLICAYYLSQTSNTLINALILNSPFLDWNLGNIETFVPFVSSIGKVLPSMKIPQGGGVYGQTIDSSYHGEWTYNTDWKRHSDVSIDAGWVRAIDQAQKYLKKHPYQIKVPILLMYSAKSFYGDIWSEDAQKSDSVLDVEDIKLYGRRLGLNVTSAKVIGGLHDLFLSVKEVRYPLYKYLFNWLNNHLEPFNSIICLLNKK